MDLLLKERVLGYLPSNPYCSESNAADMIRTKKIAVTYPTIQMNPIHLCAWLIFDVDKIFNAGEYLWDKAGVAVPNIVAINPKNQHFHMFYAISPVYTTPNARRHPLDYLAAIERTYTELLGADKGYAHLVSKNPLHSDWQVICFHSYQYDLGDLFDQCPLDKLLPKEHDRSEIAGIGRHTDIFDALRRHAYKHINNPHGICEWDYDSWYQHLLYTCEQLNVFSVPLPWSHVRSTAKSVARWTWRHRATIKVKERKLELDMSQPLATRQAIGALHTHDVRKDKTREAIITACTELKTNNAKVTQASVCRHSGLHRNTVAKYRDIIKSMK
ncbi:replication initiation protein [Photobacterium piscicola]|uniref:replication initiation protein n=1 Tax=Photobacterium piscicola TaxID=1378299 RepID=UPI002E16F903|nr:replication initiation protein [Photobacterium piscicola]